MNRPWVIVLGIGVVAGAFACLGAILLYSGAYNVAGDVPHTKPVYWLLDTARTRSIAVRARSIVVPSDLSDPKRIAGGASEYAEMCSGCHLAPGMGKTEMSQGLYPAAPELSLGSELTPAEEFWVIKHGIKMTAMPAWGRTHDDELLWDMVAFLQELPTLSPKAYRTLLESAPKSHDETMHEHMPGMKMDGDNPSAPPQ
jgi:mono/diheme cytochrome c family protein